LPPRTDVFVAMFAIAILISPRRVSVTCVLTLFILAGASQGCGGGAAGAPDGSAPTGIGGMGTTTGGSTGGSAGHPGERSAAGASGSGAASATGGTQAGWGETTRGPDAGPFVDVKLFRAGCGHQLWGRWIDGSTATLKETTIYPPSGNAITKTYFQEITFTGGKKSIFLLSDNDSAVFDPGTYKVDLQLTGTSGTHTYTVQAKADDEIYRWPGRLSLQSVARRPSSDMRLTINSIFDGSIIRVFLYDTDPGANFGCTVSQTVFESPVDFQNGIATELDLSSTDRTAGRHWLALLQGSEPAVDWTFYSTFELVTP
jgi:hypothetical protein